MVAVYAILNIKTGVVYVGGSTQFQKRISNHFVNLKIGKHENPNLQAAYNRDGRDCFIVVLLEKCYTRSLKQREQFWMGQFSDKYNIVPNAKGGRKPGPLTPEWRERIGRGALGNKGNRGVPRNALWRKRLSEAGKKRWAREKAL